MLKVTELGGWNSNLCHWRQCPYSVTHSVTRGCINIIIMQQSVQAWWHPPLVPALLEAEARELIVQAHCGKFSDLARLFQNSNKVLGMYLSVTSGTATKKNKKKVGKHLHYLQGMSHLKSCNNLHFQYQDQIFLFINMLFQTTLFNIEIVYSDLILTYICIYLFQMRPMTYIS